MSEISINAKVECVDGPCGQVITLIVDRATRKVTHLVIEDETLPYKPYQRMVPIDQLAEATRDLVRLRCKRDDVAEMEPFIQTHYIKKTELSYSVLQGGGGPPADASEVGVSYSKFDEEKIPEGAVAIKPGTRVAATDGHVGVVGDLVVDPESGEVTHFGLQTGGAKGKAEISLPLTAIDHVAGDTVYLKLSEEAIAQLPAIPLRQYHVKGTEEPAKIDLVAVAFDAPEDAGQALEFVERSQKKGALKVLNAAVLVKDAAGNVTIKDTRDIDPKKGRRLGAVTGGLIGLVGGPVGVVVGALAGAGAGGVAGAKIDFGFSEQFLEGLKKYLKPDTSALILLVEHGYYQQLSEVIAEEEGVFFQQTLTDKLVEQLLAAGEEGEPGN
jgi:uncharacterized membrane protein/sporulation protein YlmC with PRC-barrel domain